MSSIDLQTGKISGCKEGSWNWFHELGHFEFHKKYPENAYLRELCIVITVFLLSICFLFSHYSESLWLFILPVAVQGVYFSLYLYEEIWCWKYAVDLKPNKKLNQQIREAKYV